MANGIATETAGTRFRFQIMPRDGSRHRYFSTDLDAVVIPARDDRVSFDVETGYVTEVLDVVIYPTMDPAVWVTLRSFFPDTELEAIEIANAAKAAGWREIG